MDSYNCLSFLGKPDQDTATEVDALILMYNHLRTVKKMSKIQAYTTMVSNLPERLLSELFSFI